MENKDKKVNEESPFINGLDDSQKEVAETAVEPNASHSEDISVSNEEVTTESEKPSETAQNEHTKDNSNSEAIQQNEIAHETEPAPTSGKRADEQLSRNAAQSDTQHSSLINKSEVRDLKHNKIFLGGIIVAIVVVIVLLCTLFGTPTINMNKYTTVTYDGYDGYGTANVEIDWDKLTKDCKGKLKYTSKANKQFNAVGESLGFNGNMEDVADPTSIIQMAVSASIDNDDNGSLSNGDKVDIKYDVSESVLGAIKAKIKATDKTEKVKDLKKVNKADVFKNITVKFDGANGEGTATVEMADGKKDDSDDLDGYTSYFSLDKNSELSNGDTVTVKFNKDSLKYFVGKYGEAPKENKKEYKVEGLSKYIESASDVSNASMEELKTQSEDILREDFASTFSSSAYDYGTPEYVGNYVLQAKDSSSMWYSPSHSIIGMVYKVTLTGKRNDSSYTSSYNFGATDTAYFAVYYGDMLIDGDGNITSNIVSSGKDKYNSFESEDLKYHPYGYESIDSLKSDVVDSNASKWTAEWNVSE